MQRLPAERARARRGQPASRLALVLKPWRRRAIGEQRMADMGHMHADLVGAPGFQPALDQGGLRAGRLGTVVMRHRVAAGPSAHHRHFSRGRGWRPSGASMVPRSGAAGPRRGRDSRAPAGRCGRDRRTGRRGWCAASVLATTMTPEVSLSRRWTMPGRRTPPMPDRLSPQWWISALTSVPVPWPAPDEPRAGRLVDDDQVVVLVDDREVCRLRRRFGRRRPGGGAARSVLRRRPSPRSRAPACHPARRGRTHEVLEPRARQIRKQRHQRPVEPGAAVGHDTDSFFVAAHHHAPCPTEPSRRGGISRESPCSPGGAWL